MPGRRPPAGDGTPVADGYVTARLRECFMVTDFARDSPSTKPSLIDRSTFYAETSMPDAKGRFGRFGGKYAPETLMPALDELEAAYAEARRDPKFQDVVDRLARDYVGRPTPLYFARNLSELGGGARIYLK